MVEDDELREDLPERAGRRNIPSTKWPVHWPPAGCSGCSLPRPSGRFWAARGRAIEDRPGAGGVPSRRAEMRKRQRTLLPEARCMRRGVCVCRSGLTRCGGLCCPSDTVCTIDMPGTLYDCPNSSRICAYPCAPSAGAVPCTTAVKTAVVKEGALASSA
jgi:hypothetical protein